jgi:membrane-associated protease RseP (regulator of RpoE activity)
MLYGLVLSQPAANPQSGYIEIGFPLIFQAAARCLHLAIPLSAMSLHPIAAAAWVGMFATALNLLPGGQLDGGHIVYAIRARLHRPVSILVILAMIIMGKLYWGGWFIWAFMLILTFRHPMVPQEPAVRGRRKWIAAFGLLMLILTFGSKPLVYNSQEPAPSMRETISETYHWLADTAKHYLHPRKP